MDWICQWKKKFTEQDAKEVKAHVYSEITGLIKQKINVPSIFPREYHCCLKELVNSYNQPDQVRLYYISMYHLPARYL